MTDFSKAKLLEFLDFLGNKGLMNKATVAARKAATNTFLGILKPDEAQDLRKIDFDEVAIRFSNLKGPQFKPESIKVYKSRVSSALEDLKRYRTNPISYKPSFVVHKIPPASKTEKESTKQPFAKNDQQIDEGQGLTFPVPIRPNVVIKITGIPSDLTKTEASKIANVVLALATESKSKA